MITQKEPASWQELQNYCAMVLQQCGLDAETEKLVKLVRGKAEIDVFATENHQGRNYMILIECKYWSRKVPQHVVHSFRTVMGDVGANIGYIISKAGFQAGAYEAAESTNIKLLTWPEFQQVFMEQWFRVYFTHSVAKHLERLDDYLEDAIRIEDWHRKLTRDELDSFRKLQLEHCFLKQLFYFLLPYSYMLQPQTPIFSLPLSTHKFISKGLPEALISAQGYREFFEELCDYCEPIMAAFKAFEHTGKSRLVD